MVAAVSLGKWKVVKARYQPIHPLGQGPSILAPCAIAFLSSRLPLKWPRTRMSTNGSSPKLGSLPHCHSKRDVPQDLGVGYLRRFQHQGYMLLWRALQVLAHVHGVWGVGPAHLCRHGPLLGLSWIWQFLWYTTLQPRKAGSGPPRGRYCRHQLTSLLKVEVMLASRCWEAVANQHPLFQCSK